MTFYIYYKAICWCKCTKDVFHSSFGIRIVISNTALTTQQTTHYLASILFSVSSDTHIHVFQDGGGAPPPKPSPRFPDSPKLPEKLSRRIPVAFPGNALAMPVEMPVRQSPHVTKLLNVAAATADIVTSIRNSQWNNGRPTGHFLLTAIQRDTWGLLYYWKIKWNFPRSARGGMRWRRRGKKQPFLIQADERSAAKRCQFHRENWSSRSKKCLNGYRMSIWRWRSCANGRNERDPGWDWDKHVLFVQLEISLVFGTDDDLQTQASYGTFSRLVS